MTGAASGRRPRSLARTLPSVSRPRARWALAMTVARSTIAGTASSVASATKANRGDSAPPLEIEDEAARLRRQPEQPDRGRDREQPHERLAGEVDALERRVERPDREQDVSCPPG